MTTSTFRVLVRGEFDRLTDGQRAELLARAADHDPLRAAFTPDGQLTYDVAVRPAFAFRFLLEGETAAEVTGRAEEAARAWLAGRGYGHKHLRSTADDLSQAPLGARQRRATRPT